MAHTLTGTLRGTTIELDVVEREEREVADGGEGRRVRVVVEPIDDAEVVLTADQQERLLLHWAEAGPQGPIDDEGAG